MLLHHKPKIFNFYNTKQIEKNFINVNLKRRLNKYKVKLQKQKIELMLHLIQDQIKVIKLIMVYNV